MELVCRLTALGTSPVLHLSGEIDLSTIPLLHDQLGRAMALHPGTTLYVDLDGVVGLNEHPLAAGDGGWHRIRPIQENVDALLQRQDSGRHTLIFTTSRSGRFRAAVDAELRRLGFDAFQLVMDLPHARRILINDFAPTNAFPTAEAINIPRDARWLDEMLPPA